jgi:YD repeat-containing protein
MTETTPTILSQQYLDGLGRTIIQKSQSSTASQFDWVNTAYTLRGNTASVSIPYTSAAYDSTFTTSTKYVYDLLDRPVTITNPGNTKTQLDYSLGDAATEEFLATKATDENGNAVVSATDSAGAMIRRTKLGNGNFNLTTKYDRDRIGQLVKITDPRGAIWNYTFDLAGRRTQVQDPDLGKWIYTYDAASQLVSQTDARGTKTDLTYDAVGRVTSKWINGYNEGTQFGYDSIYQNSGRLYSATRDVYATPGSHAQHLFTYDIEGRMLTDTTVGVKNQDRVASYSYYPSGQLKTRSFPDGTSTGDHVYDPAGRLKTIANTAGASPDMFVRETQYNSRGQPTLITLGNWVSNYYTYEANRGWVKAIGRAYTSPSWIFNATLTRDAAGRITAKSIYDLWQGIHNWTYGYDTLNRLTSASDTFNGAVTTYAYAYDDADNMVRNSALCASNPNISYGTAAIYARAAGASTGGPHAPSAICGVAPTYDANGNTLTYDPDGTGPLPKKSFTYDGENRPVSVADLDAATGAVIRSTGFDYAADGERAKKTTTDAEIFYVSGDAELRFDAATPAGLMTAWVTPDVRKDGAVFDYVTRDELGSVRVSSPQHGLNLHPLRCATDQRPRPRPDQRQSLHQRALRQRDRPAIPARQILRPQPRPLPDARHLGPGAARCGHQPLCLCGQ